MAHPYFKTANSVSQFNSSVYFRILMRKLKLNITS